MKYRTRRLQTLVKKLRVATTPAQRATLKANSNAIKQLLAQVTQIIAANASSIQTTQVVNLPAKAAALGKKVKKALKVGDRNFAANKKAAQKALASFLKLLV